MKKNAIKGILDLVLVVVLVLMYSKNVISMAFHEIGGLALCGLFLIHKGLNWSWICSVGRKLFSPKLSGRARGLMILDIALLVAFVLIAVSGLAISKVVLGGESPSTEMRMEAAAVDAAADADMPDTMLDTETADAMPDMDATAMPRQGGGGAWKTIHYFCAALALLVVGIHVGLHGAFIAGRLRAIGLKRCSRVVCAVLVICALGLGVYGVTQTSFARWLTMPFSTGAQPDGAQMRQRMAQSEDADEAQSDETTDAAQPNDADGGAQANRTRMKGRGQSASFSITKLLSVLGGFGGIVAVAGVLTYWFDKKRAKKKVA